MMNLPPEIVEGTSSSMDQAFLPYDIMFNILSRVPAKTVVRCKCVCKSWLELLETLLETPEFFKDHLSKSVPGLIVYHDVFKIFEFVDELDLDHHSLHYNLVTIFDKTAFTSTPPHDAMGFKGSTNGLVLLCGYRPYAVYICNPTTREYIELPCLDPCENSNLVAYGFGVSLTSGQYKVVRISQEDEFDPETNECWVYTLGTGAWRSIAPCPFYDCNSCGTAAFFNGNLHWLVHDTFFHGRYFISCFDLETEVFSTFSPPPLPYSPSSHSGPVVFEDCLCACDNTPKPENEIVIWVMKEYGNETSWTKQFVFTKHPDSDSRYLHCIYPLKLFEDGDILLLWEPLFLFYYSKKNKNAKKLDLFELHEFESLKAELHISSFLSLGSFAMETVRKF